MPPSEQYRFSFTAGATLTSRTPQKQEKSASDAICPVTPLPYEPCDPAAESILSQRRHTNPLTRRPYEPGHPEVLRIRSPRGVRLASTKCHKPRRSPHHSERSEEPSPWLRQGVANHPARRRPTTRGSSPNKNKASSTNKEEKQSPVMSGVSHRHHFYYLRDQPQNRSPTTSNLTTKQRTPTKKARGVHPRGPPAL